MKTTGDNNFCHIFELPDKYPSDFCFGGGHPVAFQMVDWFNPIPEEDIWDDKVKNWQEYVPMLKKFLIDKNYVMPNKSYLLITNFGKAFIFSKE